MRLMKIPVPALRIRIILFAGIPCFTEKNTTWMLLNRDMFPSVYLKERSKEPEDLEHEDDVVDDVDSQPEDG